MDNYKEKIEAAKKQLKEADTIEYNLPDSAHAIRTTVYAIFPELAESEDEKVGKYIIKVIHEWWERCNDPSPDFPNEEKMLAYLEKQGEQKPEWSEEDESLRRRCIGAIDMANLSDYTKDDLLNWLRSLRPQKQWKPSEEQIGLLQAIVNEPNNAASESCQIALKEVIRQLKAL